MSIASRSTSFDYVRAYYGVPVKRGRRVRYYPDTLEAGYREGVITRGSTYVHIRLDGERHSKPYHPTWHLDYLDGKGPLGMEVTP